MRNKKESNLGGIGGGYLDLMNDNMTFGKDKKSQTLEAEVVVMCRTEVQFWPLLPEIARASTSFKSSHKLSCISFNIFHNLPCFSQSL